MKPCVTDTQTVTLNYNQDPSYYDPSGSVKGDKEEACESERVDDVEEGSETGSECAESVTECAGELEHASECSEVQERWESEITLGDFVACLKKFDAQMNEKMDDLSSSLKEMSKASRDMIDGNLGRDVS